MHLEQAYQYILLDSFQNAEKIKKVIVAPLSSKIKNYKGNPVLNPAKINGL